MIPLLVLFALAASSHPPNTYKLVGEGSANVVYRNLTACERARQALRQKNEKQRTELIRKHPSKIQATHWVVEPTCLPW